MIEELLAKFLVVVMLGYLLGSIPFGLLISKCFARVDVRDYGSGKIGSTNVLRVAGKKAAALVLILDGVKGALAVIIGGLIVGKEYLIWGNFGFGLFSAQILAALAAIAGHIWSLFLGFSGGRGVATFFGGLAVLNPMVALFGGEVVVLGAGLTRFVSLGSIAGAVGTYAILVPLTIYSGFPLEYLIYSLVGTMGIIIMHRDNISRLVAGQERRLGEKTAPIRSSSEKSPG